MSKIVEKAFDASKKIVRSIFRGSPNLITTSDLNRQLEALKYQVDKLDEKTGFIIEGANLGYKLENSTLKIDLVYDTMEFKGCSFAPDQTIECSINLTASAPYAYLCLVAEKETVTYDTDTTHEIAGAKFEDGTSMRAADQIRYKNETFVLTHSLESVENYVGVLAFFRYNNGNVYVNENWTSLYSPLRVMDGSGNVGANFETTQKYPIKLGDNYDVAFGKIADFISGQVYTGAWLYTHASIEEVSNEDYETSKASTPAYLIKAGSVFKVYLGGLSRETVSSLTFEDIKNNVKNFLIAINTLDCEGGIIFSGLPKNYNIGRLISADVTLAGPITITQNKSTKEISCAFISASEPRKSDYSEIPEATMISLTSKGNAPIGSFEASDYSEISVDCGMRPIFASLTFANKDYFGNTL